MKKCEKQLFYFSHFFMVAGLLGLNRCHWQIAKVKIYNLKVTEVRYPAFPTPFPGIFNFTVGILFRFWACQIEEKSGTWNVHPY